MFQKCSFNNRLDVSEVVPGLSVVLSEAISTGVVKDIGVASEPNGIDDVDKVGSRVEDSFHAFDVMHRVQNDTSGAYVNQGQGGSHDPE